MNGPSIRKTDPTSREALLHGFRTTTFNRIPFTISRMQIEDSIGHFADFLTLPEKLREKLVHEKEKMPGLRGQREGFKGRNRKNGTRDPKEYMQFHPQMEFLFHEERGQHPEFDRLLTSMLGIQRAMIDPARLVTSRLGIEGDCFPRNGHPLIYLRYNHYIQNRAALTKEQRKAIAAGHYDLGCITFAIAESGPGLQIGGDYGTPMVPITHHPDHAIVMAGYNLPKKIPNQGIVPSWHEVVYDPQQQPVNKETERWSIVMFVDAPGLGSCEWEDSHIRRGTPPEERARIIAERKTA